MCFKTIRNSCYYHFKKNFHLDAIFIYKENSPYKRRILFVLKTVNRKNTRYDQSRAGKTL